MHDDCVKQEQWGMLGEKLRQYDRHLDESDKSGGYRDRVNSLERSMRLVPYITGGCAFAGGLVAQIVPQLGTALADFIGLLR